MTSRCPLDRLINFWPASSDGRVRALVNSPGSAGATILHLVVVLGNQLLLLLQMHHLLLVLLHRMLRHGGCPALRNMCMVTVLLLLLLRRMDMIPMRRSGRMRHPAAS